MNKNETKETATVKLSDAMINFLRAVEAYEQATGEGVEAIEFKPSKTTNFFIGADTTFPISTDYERPSMKIIFEAPVLQS